MPNPERGVASTGHNQDDRQGGLPAIAELVGYREQNARKHKMQQLLRIAVGELEKRDCQGNEARHGNNVKNCPHVTHYPN
jgi:hypothetical protein